MAHSARFRPVVAPFLVRLCRGQGGEGRGGEEEELGRDIVLFNFLVF